MNICDQCDIPLPVHGLQCPHCGGMLMRTPLPPASSGSSRLFKVLKWLFIGLAALALLGTGAVLLILNSLGPMPSFG